MAVDTKLRRGDYVKLGGGRKVYQIVQAVTVDGEDLFKIDATADHPDAAVRVQDAFELYSARRLTKLRRR